MLKINDDLKEYLIEEKDRTNEKDSQEMARRFERDPFNWQWIFKFENNCGASIIKRFCSFGFDEDLFELATIVWKDDIHMISRIYALDEDTDIFGYLTNDEVMDLLYKIKNI